MRAYWPSWEAITSSERNDDENGHHLVGTRLIFLTGYSGWCIPDVSILFRGDRQDDRVTHVSINATSPSHGNRQGSEVIFPSDWSNIDWIRSSGRDIWSLISTPDWGRFLSQIIWIFFILPTTSAKSDRAFAKGRSLYFPDPYSFFYVMTS